MSTRDSTQGNALQRLRVAILVSGRGSNMEALLKAAEADLPIDVVVVASDQPSAPALIKAQGFGVPTFSLLADDFPDRVRFDQEMARKVKESGAELVVLAGYMRLLTPAFLDEFPQRVINIHPSLLPAFPGLRAQRQALEYGVRWAGCTAHFVDAGMDSGPIILQAAVPVEADDDEERLAKRILEQEHRLLPEAVRLFAEGRLRIEGRRVHILSEAEIKA